MNAELKKLKGIHVKTLIGEFIFKEYLRPGTPLLIQRTASLTKYTLKPTSPISSSNCTTLNTLSHLIGIGMKCTLLLIIASSTKQNYSPCFMTTFILKR